jgi:hypothetical protein
MIDPEKPHIGPVGTPRQRVGPGSGDTVIAEEKRSEAGQHPALGQGRCTRIANPFGDEVEPFEVLEVRTLGECGRSPRSDVIAMNAEFADIGEEGTLDEILYGCAPAVQVADFGSDQRVRFAEFHPLAKEIVGVDGDEIREPSGVADDIGLAPA